MKYIETVELPPRGKTKRFEVRTKGAAERDGVPLGVVKWHPGWRCFAFFPNGGTLYEPTCLRDLADFCEAQTKARKAERAEELKGLAK